MPTASAVFATSAVAFFLLIVPVTAMAQEADPSASVTPHIRVLNSMRALPLGDDARSYRLIWHAWHKKPGMLTLVCDSKQCSAELRHTDGYGTYRQGTLEDIYTKRVERAKAHQVMAALESGGLWALAPQVLDENGKRTGLPQDSVDSICLHAPHYYIEAKDSGRSLLAYRYCQSNYMDGLNAVAPLIALFDELFPVPLAKIKPTPPKKVENIKTGDVN